MNRRLLVIFLFVGIFVFGSCEKNTSKNNNFETSNVDFEELISQEIIEENHIDDYIANCSPYTPRQQCNCYFDNECYLRTGYELMLNYQGELKLEEDYLYLFNPYSDTIEKQFSDYHFTETNSLVQPFSVQSDGVYAIIDKNSLALFDKEGEIKKIIYSSKDEIIKDFFVYNDFIWLFSGNSILRINKITNECINIISNINSDDFCMFLFPISNNEVEWQEYAHEFWDEAQTHGFKKNTKLLPTQIDSFDSFLICNSNKAVYTAKYYNVETNNLISKDIYPLSEINTIGKGWWRIPNDASEQFESFDYAIPSNFIESGYNYNITTGGGKYITNYNLNNGNPVGFIAIDYDICYDNNNEPVIVSYDSLSYNNLSDLSKINDFLYTANVTILDYAMDDKPQNYYIAFALSDKKPVFVFCLRSDLFEKDYFLNICNTINIK